MKRRALALVLLLLFVSSAAAPFDSRARQQTDAAKAAKPEAPAARTLYRIALELDLEARAYTGLERVRWVNRADAPTTVLYFHLYPNLRAEDERPGAPPAEAANA